jgi:hypothetical protein
VEILVVKSVLGLACPYDLVMSEELARWRRLQRLAGEIAERSRECAAAATSMSEAVDDIATAPRPRLAGGLKASISASPFSDDRDVIAAAESALFVAAVIRMRVVEGGFWTDARRQNALLRWVVRTLGPIGVGPAEHEATILGAESPAA